MSALKYYFDLMSQPSRAVYVFLKITKIPFEPYAVALRKGEHRTDDFKQNFNKFQKVPFIHHGDFKLAESIAIVRYLSKQYKDNVPDYLYPSDAKEQAKVDEFLEWQHLNIRLHCAQYFWYKWLIPNITQSPPDDDKIERLESAMLGSISDFEDLFLSQGHKYVVGNTLTVADIFAACELEQPRIAGYDVCQNRPKLKSWLDSVKKDCDPFFAEANVFVDKFAKKTLAAKM
uniref:Glutathione-S-transferase theta class 1 n=1 Tax=Sitophilus oryzae TaxID=7048 RepID=A0A2S0BZF9_SITOR|nr:glutathione-S-transferase theta class 1 [Sitophilus oryzae]AVR54963.1 glutathione-s-transferase theta class 3 [Sitophilus oryzae]